MAEVLQCEHYDQDTHRDNANPRFASKVFAHELEERAEVLNKSQVQAQLTRGLETGTTQDVADTESSNTEEEPGKVECRRSKKSAEKIGASSGIWYATRRFVHELDWRNELDAVASRILDRTSVEPATDRSRTLRSHSLEKKILNTPLRVVDASEDGSPHGKKCTVELVLRRDFAARGTGLRRQRTQGNARGERDEAIENACPGSLGLTLDTACRCHRYRWHWSKTPSRWEFNIIVE
ncbi:hypothetical protein OE88DRAFT_1644042 [Heliocybe sulcata]|uniref:Uncharacterized protein n=1 Tax=Heliocybe sulcata TaxID=5364 RepID=A0A5C3N4K0_9AGAM|nr:hypothetical protein OE88DRAFT_1644042 [Heliocybe sulcata]